MRFAAQVLIWFLKLIRPQVDASPGRVYIGKRADFPPGRLHPVEVNGASVVVAQAGDSLCAVANQCAHLPVPLEGGRVEDGTVICPFHNSQFDLCTGENLDWTPGVVGIRTPKWTRDLIALGREPRGIQSYNVTVEGDNVYVDVFVQSG